MVGVFLNAWSAVFGWIQANMLVYPQTKVVWYTMISTSSAALLFIAMGNFEAGYRSLVLMSLILYGLAVKDHLSERKSDGMTFGSLLRTKGFIWDTIGNVGIISGLYFLIVALFGAFGFLLLQNLVFTAIGVLDISVKFILGQGWSYPYSAAGLPVGLDTIVDGMKVTIWLWVGLTVWYFMYFTRQLVNCAR